MLIAQISDTHITAPNTLAYGVAPMAENLKRCVAHINQLKPRPDVVLVTGDISQSGLAIELEYAASILAELCMPYYVIPGNHDDRAALWRVFGGQSCPDRAAGYINYVVDDYDIRLIALDSTVLGEPGGEICEARADWLDQCLAQAPTKPTLIFMHHPPIKFGVIETDIDGFVGADLLTKVVKKYQNIEKITCGHIHLASNARWLNTVVSTAPSMGMQLVLDLTLSREAFTLATPAFQLHLWRDQQLITHTVQVESQASYLFE
ncbi:MAG: phosphodiesterase [Arenicellales bacterium]